MKKENMTDFLNEMIQDEISLDQALQEYGYMLEDSELDQAVSDYRESRLAIKRTLKRIAKENDLREAEDLLD